MKELEYILKNSSINKEKDAEIPHVKLSYLGESIVYYFPDDFTPKQKVELIEKLVKEWHEKQVYRNETKQPGR